MQEETEKETVFDKERQRADQAEANLRKIKAEKEAANANLAQMQSRISEQQAKIDELSAKSSASKTIADKMPTVSVDDASAEEIAKAVNAAKEIIAEQAQELAALKAKTTNYEKTTYEREMAKQTQERNNSVLNKVCEELEREFGTGLRNDAIALMEQKNSEQGDPDSAALAVLRLRDCFKAVKKSKTSDNKPPISDTGSSRVSLSGVKLKKGSLAEVSAQMKKTVI